jgi:hypothetical protein
MIALFYFSIIFLISVLFLTYLDYNIYYNYYNNKPGIKVLFWNCLSEGLGYGEFMTNGGDSVNIKWSKRKYKIAQKIGDQLSQGHIVTCVEIDNYSWMVNYINKIYPELQINSMFCPKIDNLKNYSNNNLSKYITQLLNKYDSSITITPNLETDSLTDAYNQLLDYCDYNLDPEFNLPTFSDNDVSDDYLKFLSTILNVNLKMNMPYVSFDGSVIFWSDKYFTKITNILYPEKNSIDYKNIYNINYNKDCFMGIRLLDNNTHTIFDVFVGHIKSGENSISELKRVNSITTMLEFINDVSLKNRVICIDSNTSYLYQKQMKLGDVFDKQLNLIGNLSEYVTEIWENYKYTNIISQNKDTMCLKMRAGSQQLHKNGELMADTIDAILIPNNINSTPYYPYSSGITQTEYKNIIKWRTDTNIRKNIKKECLERLWGGNFNDNTFSNNLVETLVNDNTIENDNTIDNYNININDISFVKTIFEKMYPNNNNPSDHPMVGATIYFN